MKKRDVLIGLLFSCCFMKAQTVTPTVYSNGGSYNSASGGSISWTVGEPISETYTITTNKTTMGFHQPELGVATLIKEQGDQKEILVFPNPVSEKLTVSFGDLEKGKYKMQLLDASGKTVQSSEVIITDQVAKVDLVVSSYANGIYFLRISNSSFNKTIKLNKVSQ